MLATMCGKIVGNQCSRRLICISIVFISLNLLRSQRSLLQVDALISPKARICFNSMSTSFQSECVYCDSRLYTSTMLACTGQPTLANNVTQAQAFCIATACLEVSVLNKAEPLKAANQFFANYVNKLNLFRPSLLFGARNDRVATSAAATAAASAKYQKMFGPLLNVENELVAANQPPAKKFLLPNYLRQEVIDRVTDYVPQVDPKTGLVVDSPTSGEPTITTTKPPKAKVNNADSAAGATTAAAIGTQLTATAQTDETTNPVEYPDFSKMHAKIYSNSMEHHPNKRNKFFWRPFAQYPLVNNNQRQQQQSISYQMSNLMHAFSSRLAEKGAYWQTGKVPVVLGRRKRSLLPSFSFNLNKNKQKLQNNGTVTAQLNKSVNGTSSGSLAFTMNKPSAAYIWSNPLTKVFTKNSPNKSLQWQFGKGQTVAGAAAAPTAPAAVGQMSNPQAIRPAVMAATSGPSPPTARPLNVPMNSPNPPRTSLTPLLAQQFGPTNPSLVQQIDPGTADTANSGGGSFVVPAGGLASRAARG